MTWPPFLLHAVLAGTAIAVAAGLVGYFVVLRAQVFTGDALSHVAFTGALAALALGFDERFGLFVATIGVGIALGALGGRGRADDVVIGSVFAWILGLGVFFLTLFTTYRSTGNSSAGVDVLFGSIFGLNLSQATTAAIVAAVIAVVVIAIARPLLFASIDNTVAAARGIPVRILGYGFLALVGAAAAEATQAVGALLLLGLLAAPAGTAHRLTTRPYAALLLSAGLAVAAMWAGLALSYTLPALPPSFAILAVATGGYALALLATRHRAQRPEPRGQSRHLAKRASRPARVPTHTTSMSSWRAQSRPIGGPPEYARNLPSDRVVPGRAREPNTPERGRAVT